MLCNKSICFTSESSSSARLLIPLKAGAGLKDLVSQILQERLRLRLDLVWSFFHLQILKETLHLRLELV